MSRSKGMVIAALIGMATLTLALLVRAPSEREVCEHVQQLLRRGAVNGDTSQSDEAGNKLELSSEGAFNPRQLRQQCVEGLEKRREGLGHLEYRNQARCIIGATKLTQLDACAGQEM